jgi:hypothetical protein
MEGRYNSLQRFMDARSDVMNSKATNSVERESEMQILREQAEECL